MQCKNLQNSCFHQASNTRNQQIQEYKEKIDKEKLLRELHLYNPFSGDCNLRNVVTGIVASENVNVHKYEQKGQEIINKMIGESVFKYSFKRKDKAKTFGDTSSVKINNEQVICSELQFQGFLVVSQSGDMALNDIMLYELSPYPPALFKPRISF